MIFNCRFKSFRYAALAGGIVVSVLFPADRPSLFKNKAKASFQDLLKKGKAYLDDEQFRRRVKRSAIEVGVFVLFVGGAYYLGRYGNFGHEKSLIVPNNITILKVPKQTVGNSCGVCAFIHGAAIVDSKAVSQPYDKNEIERFYNCCNKKIGQMLDQNDLQTIIDATKDLKDKNFCIFGGLDLDRFMSKEEIGERIGNVLSGKIEALPVLVHVNGNHWIVDVLRKGDDGNIHHTIADSMNGTTISKLYGSLKDLITSGIIAKEQKEKNEEA